MANTGHDLRLVACAVGSRYLFRLEAVSERALHFMRHHYRVGYWLVDDLGSPVVRGCERAGLSIDYSLVFGVTSSHVM